MAIVAMMSRQLGLAELCTGLFLGRLKHGVSQGGSALFTLGVATIVGLSTMMVADAYNTTFLNALRWGVGLACVFGLAIHWALSRLR